MSHEIAPKDVYVSPHLKGVMRERQVYISGYQPNNLDLITQGLGIPNIEDKRILLKSWDKGDTFHEKVDVNLIVSLSPNALNPQKPKHLTRAIGRAILMDPTLNPDYRVPNPLTRKDFWRLLGLFSAGGGMAVGTGLAALHNHDLPPANELYGGIGGGILAGTTVRYGYTYLVKPMALDAYDAWRVHRFGNKIESPFTLSPTA